MAQENHATPALPSTPESDILTAHFLLPSLGIPGTAGGQ